MDIVVIANIITCLCAFGGFIYGLVMVVEVNRKKGDAYYDVIGTCADLNGCVNPQWLALYAERNEAKAAILSDSLKVVVGSTKAPNGYETGIHMFGEQAAFNLNNANYIWNGSAKSIMVYYQFEKAAPALEGSSFSGGTLALAAGLGVALGAGLSVLCMKVFKKKEKSATAQ